MIFADGFFGYDGWKRKKPKPGMSGGCAVVQYRLLRVHGSPRRETPVPDARITEKFDWREDPYGVGKRIIVGTFRTDRRGRFDDVISFATPDPVPRNFRLVGDQEIFADGRVVARNLVTWTFTSIYIRPTDKRRSKTISVPVRIHSVARSRRHQLWSPGRP